MDEDTIANAEAFCARDGLHLLGRLGNGIHGIVFVIESNVGFGPAALKVFYAREPYRREREAYERLRELDVSQILGFEVPSLLAFDGAEDDDCDAAIRPRFRGQQPGF
jgi:hypothetical protein